MDVHVPRAITEGLRRRGVDVLTSQEDGTRQMADADLLSRSTQLNRPLVTQDEDLLGSPPSGSTPDATLPESSSALNWGPASARSLRNRSYLQPVRNSRSCEITSFSFHFSRSAVAPQKLSSLFPGRTYRRENQARRGSSSLNCFPGIASYFSMGERHLSCPTWASRARGFLGETLPGGIGRTASTAGQRLGNLLGSTAGSTYKPRLPVRHLDEPTAPANGKIIPFRGSKSPPRASIMESRGNRGGESDEARRWQVLMSVRIPSPELP